MITEQKQEPTKELGQNQANTPNILPPLEEQLIILHERVERSKAEIAARKLQKFEKPKWLESIEARINTFEYVICPECKLEWSKMVESSGICYDCDKKKSDDFFQRKRMEEKFKRIFGSTKAMNHFTFEQFKMQEGNEEAFQSCRKFNSNNDNLYLYGNCGLGKTHLAYAAAKMYALNGKVVVVSTPLRMVDTFRTKSDTEKEDRFTEFTECDLLLIDDFGISKFTDFALEVIAEILNRRTLQMRNGLIITSNLSLEQLEQKLKDNRLPSRIIGLCKIIQLIGEDYRLK